MNFQQKLIYTVLGASIMFLGMSGTRHPNAIFDTVKCKQLLIVDEDSKNCVIVSTDDKGGIIGVYDKDDSTSTHQVGLLIGKHGGAITVTGTNGAINLRTSDKDAIVIIGGRDDRTSVDGKDDTKIILRGRGTIHTYDKNGKVTASLPPHPHPHSDTEEK